MCDFGGIFLGGKWEWELVKWWLSCVESTFWYFSWSWNGVNWRVNPSVAKPVGRRTKGLNLWCAIMNERLTECWGCIVRHFIFWNQKTTFRYYESRSAIWAWNRVLASKIANLSAGACTVLQALGFETTVFDYQKTSGWKAGTSSAASVTIPLWPPNKSWAQTPADGHPKNAWWTVGWEQRGQDGRGCRVLQSVVYFIYLIRSGIPVWHAFEHFGPVSGKQNNQSGKTNTLWAHHWSRYTYNEKNIKIYRPRQEVLSEENPRSSPKHGEPPPIEKTATKCICCAILQKQKPLKLILREETYVK